MSNPLIIVLPGGGYARHAAHEAEPIARWLRDEGFDAEVFRYPVGVRHPAPLRAVQERIEQRRTAGASVVGLIGFSAGGHLAGHVACTTPGAVDFAVLGYPVVSMIDPAFHQGSSDILLGPEPDRDARRSTSLELLVTEHAPPSFLWHTADDRSVPVRHSYLLAGALADWGVPHELHVYPRGPHGLGLALGHPAARWQASCADWLAQWKR